MTNKEIKELYQAIRTNCYPSLSNDATFEHVILQGIASVNPTVYEIEDRPILCKHRPVEYPFAISPDHTNLPNAINLKYLYYGDLYWCNPNGDDQPINMEVYNWVNYYMSKSNPLLHSRNNSTGDANENHLSNILFTNVGILFNELTVNGNYTRTAVNDFAYYFNGISIKIDGSN